MIRQIARWEFQRLTLSSPGLRASILLMLFPLAHLLPWRSIAFFPDPFQAAITVSSLYAVTVACMIGGDAGLMRRSAFWLFQKGVPPREYAAGSLVVSVVFGTALILFSSVFVLFATLLHEFTLNAVPVTTGIALLLFITIQAILFLLGSFHMSRRTDVMLLFVFVSFFSDFLLLRAPEYARKAAHFALPPAADAYSVTTGILNGSWHSAFGSLLHILAFVSVCLALGFAVQRRLRPVPAKLQVT